MISRESWLYRRWREMEEVVCVAVVEQTAAYRWNIQMSRLRQLLTQSKQAGETRIWSHWSSASRLAINPR
jgi:hypothetical protein